MIIIDKYRNYKRKKKQKKFLKKVGRVALDVWSIANHAAVISAMLTAPAVVLAREVPQEPEVQVYNDLDNE